MGSTYWSPIWNGGVVTGTQFAGESAAVVSKPNPDGFIGQKIYKVPLEVTALRGGRLTTLIGLAKPDSPRPSLPCNTRLVAVWATATRPVHTPWTKSAETGGLIEIPLVEFSITVPLKLVNVPLVGSSACITTAKGTFTKRGDGIRPQPK